MSAADGLQHISHDASPGLYYNPSLNKISDGPELFVPAYVEEKQLGRICGLQRKWFCILVGVVVVLVAAAIGGGVGGAMTRKNQTCPSKSSNNTNCPNSDTSDETKNATIGSTPSQISTEPSPTISALPTTKAEALLKLGCPSANQTIYPPLKSNQNKFPLNQAFVKFCDYDLGPITKDVSAPDIFSYQANNATLNDCIDSCVQYNIEWDEDDRIRNGPCMAVVFTALVPSQKKKNMRCYLKTDLFGKFGLYQHLMETGDVYASAKMQSYNVNGE